MAATNNTNSKPIYSEDVDLFEFVDVIYVMEYCTTISVNTAWEKIVGNIKNWVERKGMFYIASIKYINSTGNEK